MAVHNELKNIIAYRDNYRCRRCGIELKQDAFERNIDHIIPRDLIAISELWNLELLCIDCNEDKGSELPHDFQERCIRAFMESFDVERGSKENDYYKIAIKIIFKLHTNYYQSALKEHYQDDYINQNKYGYNYNILINLVRNLSLKKQFKISDKIQNKKSKKKISEKIKKDAKLAVKKIKNLIKSQEPKTDDKKITAEEKLLVQYHYEFQTKLLSFVLNENTYTQVAFSGWWINNPESYQNEIPRADEILYNHLRMFEYLNNLSE